MHYRQTIEVIIIILFSASANSSQIWKVAGLARSLVCSKRVAAPLDVIMVNTCLNLRSATTWKGRLQSIALSKVSMVIFPFKTEFCDETSLRWPLIFLATLAADQTVPCAGRNILDGIPSQIASNPRPACV